MYINKLYLFIALLLLYSPVFGLETETHFNWATNYMQESKAAGSSVFNPNLQVNFNSGLSFSSTGIFPLQNIVLPTKRGSDSEAERKSAANLSSATSYHYKLLFLGNYQHDFNPVFSLKCGFEYNWYKSQPQSNDSFFNAVLIYNFILGASLNLSYSIEKNYAVLFLPLSYLYSLSNDFELSVKTGPTFYIDARDSYFSTLQSSAELNYLYNTRFSSSLSVNHLYDFMNRKAHLYLQIGLIVLF